MSFPVIEEVSLELAINIKDKMKHAIFMGNKKKEI